MKHTSFSCTTSISFFIFCCSASWAALSGLPEVATGALAGSLATGAEPFEVAGPLDFLVPLTEDLVFGADMTAMQERFCQVGSGRAFGAVRRVD